MTGLTPLISLPAPSLNCRPGGLDTGWAVAIGALMALIYNVYCQSRIQPKELDWVRHAGHQPAQGIKEIKITDLIP